MVYRPRQMVFLVPGIVAGICASTVRPDYRARAGAIVPVPGSAGKYQAPPVPWMFVRRSLKRRHHAGVVERSPPAFPVGRFGRSVGYPLARSFAVHCVDYPAGSARPDLTGRRPGSEYPTHSVSSAGYPAAVDCRPDLTMHCRPRWSGSVAATEAVSTGHG